MEKHENMDGGCAKDDVENCAESEWALVASAAEVDLPVGAKQTGLLAMDAEGVECEKVGE